MVLIESFHPWPHQQPSWPARRLLPCFRARSACRSSNPPAHVSHPRPRTCPAWWVCLRFHKQCDIPMLHRKDTSFSKDLSTMLNQTRSWDKNKSTLVGGTRYHHRLSFQCSQRPPTVLPSCSLAQHRSLARHPGWLREMSRLFHVIFPCRGGWYLSPLTCASAAGKPGNCTYCSATKPMVASMPWTFRAARQTKNEFFKWRTIKFHGKLHLKLMNLHCT